MKASPRRSIHFTAAVLAVTVIFIITSVFFLYGVIDKVNGKTDDVVYAATCQKSEYINKYIESNFSFLKSIAVSMENYRTTELTLIKQRLKTLTQSSKFLNIIVIDENGNAISYRDEKINIESREYYKKAMNGETFLSEPIFSRPDMAMANVYAVPIYGDYQKVIGVVAAICDKNDLAAVLDMEVSGTDSTFPGCLVDVDGSITAKGNISKELIDDSFFTSGFMDGVSNEEAEALKSDFLKKDFVGIVRSQQPDGTAYFAFCSDLAADSNSHYVVVFPEEDVYQNLHGYVDKVVLMFIFFFAVILLMIGAYFFIVRSSIKTLKSANEEVSRLAYVDELTGYSTWSRFSLDAKRLLAHEYRRYVFVSFDIDKFKAINDMFGHDEGNRILKLIADTVNRNMNDGEIFSRINSDNFYMMLIYHDDEEIGMRIKNLIQAIEYEITEFVPVISFGIYRINNKNLSIRKMGDLADIAKRTVKYGDDSNYAFYSEDMLEELREEKYIENEMQSALDTHEFCVYYQPKVSLIGEPVLMGAEALVRWVKDGEVISPGRFIPLFEKNGFIIKLDYYVMDQACRSIKSWERQGYADILISVNMSRNHLVDPHFTETLNEICRRHDVSTSKIEIEITESAAYESLDALVKVFGKLKEYGFHISIDDFGSGYSSLNMLKDLPADVLKIDRVFLTDDGNKKRANDIIGHVIKMARSLGMETICEGIETDEQVNVLRSLGCDMAQGFYFARPMSCEAFEEALRNYSENKPIKEK